MLNEATCPACGTRLPAGAASHTCPVGVLQLALAGAGRPAEDTPPLAAGKRVGDYEILGLIKRGGMGVVYRARQRSLDRVVALKMIRAGDFASEQELERFNTEARAAGSLGHPHIVPIYEVGEHEGQPFYTMPFIEGGALSSRRFEDQPAANRWPAVARLMAQAARAVHHAHQRGILHRDLKPSNILLDAAGEPRITDFGLAKLLEAGGDLSRSTAVVGTPGYMAPEQAAGRNRELTTAVDIYGLGAILYELLAGRPPFTGDSTLEVLRKVVEEAPMPPSRFTNDDLRFTSEREQGSVNRKSQIVNAELEIICLKCLEKDPRQRYDSAQALAEDLERWLRHEPIRARPAWAGKRIGLWVRRHPARAVVAGMSVAVIALVLGLNWSHRAEMQRRERAAGQQREQSLRALAELGFVGTDASFNSGEAPKAIAFLARTLRENPSNQWAAERLMSALTYRSFALPALPPLRHAAALHSAQFSPDGTRILTASDDGTARLWDAPTGQPVAALSHPPAVLDARFSPDGRWIVTAGGDRTARLWDAQTARPVGEPMPHDNEVRRAEFSADSARVLTIAGQFVRAWDARTGAPLCEPLPHQGGDPNVRTAQFSPDGRYVLTADGTVARRWLVSTSTNGFVRDKFSTRIAQCARFSLDGSRFVIGSGDDAAHLWRVGATNEALALRGHRGDVDWVEFSPDGGSVVTVSKDRTARVWDAHTGELRHGPLLHEGRVTFARFSASTLRLLTLAEDRAVRVWDAESGEPICEPLRHETPVVSAEFSPDGQFIVTACADGAARVWDVRFGGAVGETSSRYTGTLDSYRKSTLAGRNMQVVQLTNLQPREPTNAILQHTVQPSLAHLSPQGRWFITREGDGALRLWNEETGEPVPRPFQHDGPIRNLSVSPDRRWFAVVGADHVVYLWSTNTALPPRNLPEHIGLAFDPLFSPDGRRVLLVTKGGTSLQLWDTATGQPASQPFAPHQSGVLCAAFSRDGQWLATGSYDMTAAISDARTGEKKFQLRHDGYVRCVEFSPDGSKLVTAADDTTAQIWDVQGGRKSSRLMRHPDAVRWATFSSNGLLLATFGGDRAARIWEAQSGRPISEQLKHGRLRDELPAWFGRFSADGTRLIAWSQPSVEQIWSVTPVAVPVPAWLPDVAETVAGQRIGEWGAVEQVPQEGCLEWRRVLTSKPPRDSYEHWAAWFFADRASRRAAPTSTLTISDYVAGLVAEEDWRLMREALPEALRLAPTNGVAVLRLARAKVKQAADSDELQRQRLRDEADLHSRRALAQVPEVREAWLARVEFLLNSNQKTNALAVAEQALARFPNDPVVQRMKTKVSEILTRTK